MLYVQHTPTKNKPAVDIRDKRMKINLNTIADIRWYLCFGWESGVKTGKKKGVHIQKHQY